MTLNPTIRATYVWLVLVFLADFSFVGGLVWPEEGGILATLVSIPVLFLAFPLSAAAAFSELPPKIQALPWIKNQRSRPPAIFAFMLAAFIFGLIPFLTSKGMATGVGWFAFLSLAILELLTIHQTLRLFFRHRERCVLRAVITQFLAFLPTAFFIVVSLLELTLELFWT